MKKVFKKMLAMVMATCFIFAFSLTANATGISLVVDEIIDLFDQPYVPENIVKYNYETGTQTVIPYDSIPKYSETATCSYEIPEIAMNVYGNEVMVISDGATLASGAISPNNIIVDTPFIRTPPTAAPYTGVALVEIVQSIKPEANGYGTCFFVSSNVVVTAAHNIVWKPENPTDAPYFPPLKIHPFFNSDDFPSATGSYVNVIDIAFDENFLITEDESDAEVEKDWAVLTLESDVQGVYNFNYSYITSHLQNQTIAMTGYPQCLNENCDDGGIDHGWCEFNFYLATSYGQIYFVENPEDDDSMNILRYTNNALGGCSGSPVYLPNNSNFCYAIHTNSAHPRHPEHKKFNRATLITECIFNVIAREVIEAL